MIALTDEMRKRLAAALMDNHPVTAAYIDTRGRPHISFYGSLHVHGDTQLALWCRNPEGELLKAIERRPEIAAQYGDIATRTYYHFEGRAAVTTDEAARKRIYDEMHELERRQDPDRKGVAVLIEVDQVKGHDHSGLVSMSRE